MRRGLVRSCVVLAIGLVWFTSAAVAREAVVTLTDGQVLEGDLTQQTDTSVTLVVGGIPRSLERRQVQSIDYPRTFEEEYADRAAAVEPGDLADQYQLAYWLFENKAYALAEHELAVLVRQLEIAAAAQADTDTDTDAETNAETGARLQPDPELIERAAVLATAIEQRVKLMVEQEAVPLPRPDAAGAPTAGSEDSADTETGGGQATSAGNSRLDPARINRIRLFEVDLSAKPKVHVDRDVWDELFTRYAERDITPKGRRDQTRMRAADGWEQLRLIFDLRAREFYDRVEILEDPPAMRTFRTLIHQRYVLNYCGTAECHGGEVDNTGAHAGARAGALTFARRFPNREDTVYGNFYQLHKARHNGAELIDRQKAERSLLLQYGLPRDQAYTPHPETPGWRPHLRDPDDPTFRLIQRWIADELYTPAPDYGIDTPAPAPEPPARASQAPARTPANTPPGRF